MTPIPAGQRDVGAQRPGSGSPGQVGEPETGSAMSFLGRISIPRIVSVPDVAKAFGRLSEPVESAGRSMIAAKQLFIETAMDRLNGEEPRPAEAGQEWETEGDEGAED